MISITVWLLIAVSDAANNRGTTTTIAHLPSNAACLELKENLEAKIRRNKPVFVCVPATVVSPKETE